MTQQVKTFTIYNFHEVFNDEADENVREWTYQIVKAEQLDIGEAENWYLIFYTVKKLDKIKTRVYFCHMKKKWCATKS